MRKLCVALNKNKSSYFFVLIKEANIIKFNNNIYNLTQLLSNSIIVHGVYGINLYLTTIFWFLPLVLAYLRTYFCGCLSSKLLHYLLKEIYLMNN